MTAPGRTARDRRAVWGAWLAALAFTIGLSRFAVQRLSGSPVLGDGQPLGAVVAIVPHVLLWTLVWPRLKTPALVRLAGLWWFVLDLGSDLLALAGMSSATFLAVRYVGHLGAVVWIAGGSWVRGGALRVVGVLTAVVLAIGTAGAWLWSPIALAPSGPLLVIWCVVLGRSIRSSMISDDAIRRPQE